MWRSRKKAADIIHDDRGSVIVELAVVVPVLLTLGLGVMEFGNIFYNYHLIANGVRDAARYAAGFQGELVCGDPAADPDVDALQYDIKSIAMTGTLVTSADFPTAAKRVAFWDNLAQTTVSCPAVYDNTDFDYRGAQTIYMVTVTANVPYTSLGFLGYLDLNPVVLTVSHEERVYNVR
jgi:Flp pilus assembly protein TadG